MANRQTKGYFAKPSKIDHVVIETKEIPDMMAKPTATVWVANPTDKPLERVHNLKDAEVLAQRYGRMAVTKGVTNEYFRTNYLLPTAWEQLRQRFTFDMGDIAGPMTRKTAKVSEHGPTTSPNW